LVIKLVPVNNNGITRLLDFTGFWPSSMKLSTEGAEEEGSVLKI